MPEENLKEYLIKTPAQDKWKRIGTQKRAGILAPLFCVYSKKSAGIGEFRDLKLLIDWAKLTGNSIIQLLPLNEVGPLFCPYDSLSSFALEPAYLSLEVILSRNKNSFRTKINQLKEEFPAGRPYLDYRIKKRKIGLLREIFLAGEEPASKDLEKFRRDNDYWIDDFVLFKALKDYHGGKPWYEWEARYKDRDVAALKEFFEAHSKEITFQIWLQWQASKQFKEVRKYAEVKKILLKGDLPFLVSRDSADVWQHRRFFKLGFAAGAPPDMYCAKGQRWGVPTYNWDEVAADDYRYLKEKLKFAQQFYDILRIDHVVGLFRIWSIPYQEPLENQGLNGFFDLPDENKWEQQGRNILSVMLNNTRMLLCAEDLGIIPDMCKKTLRELGIPGNDVQRWTKDWKIKHDFLLPQDYRVLSVAMLSTHDTTNWAAWWENEAGTVDAELFKRKCAERGVDYNSVKDKLFDLARSGHARLRWLDSINSSDILTAVLGKKREEIGDFIDIYDNTYREKEKLFQRLGLPGPMPDKVGADIIKAALKITLGSSAIFCIELILDWMYLAGILKGEPYQYRINTPGTISVKNWSLVIPLPLEDLIKHKVTKEIRSMVIVSRR
ncbi:MAG: 4-alpha-glucanotransferase [Candidatus Omnitrophica bacterium]|nr:4-alpha-glucanotransferase [Candidatus Omnitrophota bacterium]MDD5592113.1 4-alpha-glucanotransferase [Candidatus Omnitrophota bacterium]